MTALVWFRRDLRLHDHPALRAALDAHERVVPVFCFDDRILSGRHRSGPRTQFMIECLEDLDGSLRDRGAGLVIRHGPPERELVELAGEVGAEEIHFTRDVSPYARRRAGRVHDACAEARVELCGHPGSTVVDDVRELRTKNGKPYTVFTPFWRAALGAPHREVIGAPRKVSMPSRVRKGQVPRLEDLGLEERVADPVPGGETEARRHLSNFVRSRVGRYGSSQDDLGDDGTSRLSPYLHFGCLSPREVVERAPDDGKGPGAFRRQVYWADFYRHVIYHFPGNQHHEHQERYRGTLDWPGTDEQLEAWKQGRTGYPLVDAGMRQLAHEGWMHNRARLVVGSFLTKDLGCDWRDGEAHFMRLLLDGDEAVNNGNWQWIGSTGVDPAPYFRRMYNPASQMERHDPKGRYVRRWVPELEPVPDRYLREPWTMPEETQREVGCVIGEDYPGPIVDHREAREAAMERYRAAAGTPARSIAPLRSGARADSSRL